MTRSSNPAPSPPPHISVRPEWLSLHREEALEPDLPIIDAHHHLWERDAGSYRVEDFLADAASGHDIRASVFVECKTNYAQQAEPEMASLGEARFAADEARTAALLGSSVRVANVQVGFADLMLGSVVGRVLDGLHEASGNRLRSIRNIAVWHADPDVRASAATPPAGLLRHPSFHEGFSELAARGLAFDAWLIHTQIDDLTTLARKFADTTIILNHIGGPLALGSYRGRRAEVFNDWQGAMATLAECPNICVKLGGFGMPLFGFDFERPPTPPNSQTVARDIKPYVDACISLFGAERCMFESNFPVDKGSFGYGVLWNAYKRITAHLGAAERDMLFNGTARQVYRID